MYSADEIRSRLAGVLDPAGPYPDSPGERVAAVAYPNPAPVDVGSVTRLLEQAW